MGTKSEPGRYDCFAKAEPDEPMFVLLGRDRFAPSLVDLWAMARLKNGEEIGVVQEAADCAAAMRNWLYLSKKREVRVVEFIPTQALLNEIERRNAFKHMASVSHMPTDFAPSAPIALEAPIGNVGSGDVNGSPFDTHAIPRDEPEDAAS